MGFSPHREPSKLNLSRVTEVKFCPYGQSEIRLAPGEIGSGEPVKLLPPAAGGYDKPTPSQGVIFPQPFGLPFFITTAAMRR